MYQKIQVFIIRKFWCPRFVNPLTMDLAYALAVFVPKYLSP